MVISIHAPSGNVIVLEYTPIRPVAIILKLYKKLGFEPLQQWRWYRKLCYFFKLIKTKSLKYLFNNIPTIRSTYRTRNIDNIPQFNVRHTFFRNSFFPYIVTEWNNLDKRIRNSEGFSIFKKNILQFIRPSPSSIFNCHNPKGVKLLTRLRLGLSHLRDHNFKHSFQDSLNPICNCGTDVETTTQYLPSFFWWKVDSQKQHLEHRQQYFKSKWF